MKQTKYKWNDKLKIILLYYRNVEDYPGIWKFFQVSWVETKTLQTDWSVRSISTTVISSSELFTNFTSSFCFSVDFYFAALSVSSNKIRLLAVTNSHILRNKSSIPSISSIVPAGVSSFTDVSCSVAMTSRVKSAWGGIIRWKNTICGFMKYLQNLDQWC